MARSRLWCAALALNAAIAVAGGEPPKAPPVKAAPRPSTGEAKPLRPVARPVQPVSPPTLEVTVVDAAGKPIEGAFVMATPSVGAYVGVQLQTDKLRSAIAGKDGRARLERMPRAPWEVAVRARGFARGHEARVASAAVTVTLQRGGTIEGLVLDGLTKAPVPGARVSVDEGLALPGEWQSELTRNAATADARGAFRLDGIARGRTSLVASAPRYAAARRDSVRAGARVELFLFSGPTLTGTARDEGGRPIAGASVRLFGEGWSSPPAVEPTDAAGRFTAAGLDPGAYWVVARSGAKAPGLARVTLTARDDASVDVTVGEGGYASGRVVDEAGRPVPGARVRPESLDGDGLPVAVGDALAAASGEDGAFVLGPLPAGMIGFAVAHAGHATARASVVVLSRQSSDLRDVVLESGLAVRGRVRDREGVALAGVLLRAEPRGGGDGPTSEGESGADGAYALGGLAPGAYSVSATAAGFASVHVTATAGGEPLEIVLDAGGGITGRVVDAAGQPVDGASVQGERADVATEPGGVDGYAMSANDGDGRFTIRDIAPGTYALRVRAGGVGEAAVSSVKVAAGRVTDVGTITLSATGVVTGVVVDADGQGIPGATVQVRRNAQTYYSDDPSAQTDSNGAFEARGVRPGRVFVTARHPAFVEGRQEDVEVDPEKDPPVVRVVLARGGRIEGRARRRDGRPFEDGRVAATSLSSRGGGFEPVPTLADGAYVLDHVPPGRVLVTLMTRVASHPFMSGPPGMVALAGVAGREAEVREGETTTVDLATREVVVAGRVTRGGQGLPGVTVTVMSRDAAAMSATMASSPTAFTPPAGPPPLTATTREDGSYELVVFTPGKAYVQMRSPERQAFPGREVDVPDAERYELDLEVGGASVTGVVTDKDTGAPVPEAQVSLRLPGPDGEWKGGGASGPDGRFTITTEPGEYEIVASARGRRPARTPLSVGAAGVSDVRVELEAGFEIKGRVVDASCVRCRTSSSWPSIPRRGRSVRWGRGRRCPTARSASAASRRRRTRFSREASAAKSATRCAGA